MLDVLTGALTLAAGDLRIRLFKNNVTPTDASILANFTAATFTGYADITLTNGSWVTTAGAPSTATYAVQTFTCSTAGTAETIYGYVIFRNGVSKVWFVERFPAANITAGLTTISLAGQTIVINPRFTLKDEQD